MGIFVSACQCGLESVPGFGVSLWVFLVGGALMGVFFVHMPLFKGVFACVSVFFVP